jgi:SAM-dependent methyltransferase
MALPWGHVMQSSVLGYYAQLGERSRLAEDPMGQLEFLRTRELLTRWLPSPPAQVVDVGGATGAHARWIAELGHRVHVIDPELGQVIEAARLPGVTACVGEARALPRADATADVVLMLGPLYHLPSRADRLLAWSEALRVVRPGGVVAAAVILRRASLLDFASMGRLDEENLARIAVTLRTGEHDPVLGFTDAYFHTADELRTELEEVGLGEAKVLPIEGPGVLAVRGVHRAGGVVSSELLDSAVRLARVAESDPAMIEVGSHLLGVGRRST